MDVFKIDQSLSANLGSAPPPEKLTADVSFDAGSEFNLSFFDPPEDSSTQGFSDPGSVGSASASSPPPQLSLPPQVISAPSAILLQPLPGSAAPGTASSTSGSLAAVKQGASLHRDFLVVEVGLWVAIITTTCQKYSFHYHKNLKTIIPSLNSAITVPSF